MKRILLLFVLVFGAAGFIRASQDGDIISGNTLRSLVKLAEDSPDEADSIADHLLLSVYHHRQMNKVAALVNIKGLAAKTKGRYDRAIRCFTQSYYLSEMFNDAKGKVVALNNMATVFMEQGDYPMAEAYLQRGIRQLDSNDLENRKNLYLNLGVTYDYMGNASLALKTYEIALPLLLGANDFHALAIVYHNMAVIYGYRSDFAMSRKLDLTALHYQRMTGSDDLMALIGISLGSLYLDRGWLDSAEIYLQMGGDAAYRIGRGMYQEAYLINMTNLYRERNEPAKALVKMEELLVLKDSLNHLQYVRAMAEEDARFKNSITSRDLELTRMQKSVSDERARQAWILLIGTAVLALTCLILAILIYRNFLLKRKANRLLLVEKQLIEKTNDFLSEQNARLENEHIVSRYEVLRGQLSPHFLFNSLNALASLIRTDPDKALQFSNAFSSVFRNILDAKDYPLHSLRREFENVEAYIFLQQVRFGDNLRIDIRIRAEDMQSMIPPLCLQMLVENAIKHNTISQQKPLRVEIFSDGSYLVVRNNLQLRTHIEESAGVGLANIRSRYQLLVDKEPEFTVDGNFYTARLPLIVET